MPYPQISSGARGRERGIVSRRRSSSASDFTPDSNTERSGPLDPTYPLSNLHCTDKEKEAAARKVRAYVDALPIEQRKRAWEDVAGALGLLLDQ
jgi:hypothetical protein